MYKKYSTNITFFNVFYIKKRLAPHEFAAKYV